MSEPIKSVVMFDLDGCVSDDTWRQHLLPPPGTKGNEPYKAYHEECNKDPLLPSGSAILRDHIKQGHIILFCTARPITVGERTAEWVAANFGLTPQDFSILMRQAGDERGSVDLKAEFADFIIKNSKSNGSPIVAAYDDREDIVEMYRSKGLNAAVLDRNGIRPQQQQASAPEPLPSTEGSKAAMILAESASTFESRNAVYKDNAVNVGAVMRGFFPNGIQLTTAEDHRIYHLFELLVVKLTRFANSGLTHQDSIHDAIIYGAMVEDLVSPARHSIKVL